MTTTTTLLRHNKIDLALHCLADGDGTPLLLLHGLGETSPAEAPAWAADWPGPVTALGLAIWQAKVPNCRIIQHGGRSQVNIKLSGFA